MTRLDDKRMENIEECENIKNIETRLRMTRSENSSTRSKKHGQKVNLEPDPSSSDSSDSSSSDLAPKRKKIKKKKSVVSIGKMTRQTHPQVMTLIHLSTVLIGVNDAKIRNTKRRIQSDYAQL